MNIKTIRKKCKEHNIKIWTRDEIYEEYNKNKEDKNYLYLDLIGKPFFLVSPACGCLSDVEYIAYEDIKPYLRDKND